ncbi:hypothetical protein ACFL6C_13390, partial [Myxococcota bacterium]
MGYLAGSTLPHVGFDYHTWSMDETNPVMGWQTRGQDYRTRVTYIQEIQRIATENGIDDAYVISLEAGMAATQEMERDQAGYLVRSHVSSVAYGQHKLFWTKVVEYDHHPTGGSIFSHTGLVHDPDNSDGLNHEKLAYFTYKLLVETLAGSDWANTRIVSESDNICVYELPSKTSGQSVYVAWWDFFDAIGDTRVFTLTELANVGSVEVIEAIPNAASGAELDPEQYPGFFATEVLPVV